MLFALSNFHITPDDRRDLVLRRQCDGFLVAFALGHHGPRHPRNLVGESDGGDLGRPPRQQCREPWPVLGAMDLGIADDGKCAGRE